MYILMGGLLGACFLNGLPLGLQSNIDTAAVETTDTGDTYTVIVDSGVESRYCEDLDGDGFGSSDECVVRTEAPEGYVPAENGGDCDDANPDAYPGAVEIDEDIDENCDGLTDESEGDDPSKWCVDSDGDGFGAGECLAEYAGYPEYVSNDDDCDDANPNVNPSADEWEHDLNDNDCDGYVDEDYRLAVICLTPVESEIYEVFVAGSSFDDFRFAPNRVWEPGESWLSLVTEANGASESDDEASELILGRELACALYDVEWGEEFVLNGLSKMAGEDVRLLADARHERRRVASVMVDGKSTACLLEETQFRCVRP